MKRAGPAAVDGHNLIEVRGARENNLADISLDIPKRQLTVFTGVSGSGKSSLVFGTIAAESRRMINETYTAFIQSFMPQQARPEVDALRNLSAAIVVDQERMGANSRSTVGTATDASTMLRIVFSRLGTPHVGTSAAFSFNNAEGMCPDCEGLGRVSDIDIAQLVDRDRSLNDGAIIVPNFGIGTWNWQIMADSGYFDPDVPLKKFTKKQWEQFLHQPETKIKVSNSEAKARGVDTMNMTYEGLVVKVKRLYLSKERESLRPHLREFVDAVATFADCRACGGTRLNRAALSSKIRKRNIADCSAMQINDLADFVRGIKNKSVGPVVGNLGDTLDSLVEIGLGYLSLDRETGTLSGGESQRLKMVRYLGSSLTDVTYVFDEPTVGLHPHDIQRMNELLIRLRDNGNTVLVVEHKPEMIEIADHVVDLGPGAGSTGGRVCFEGEVAALRRSDTLTGRYLDHRVRLREPVRVAEDHLSIKDADRHNLKNVSVDIPLRVLTVVTGVAGSGKSSLIHGSLADEPGVVVVDQSPIRGSRRSNPATYSGLLDAVRAAYAKANGVKPALFSANSEGACPNCKGIGMVYTDLAMLGSVAAVCEQCEGRRFTAEVLTYKLHGKDISQVLNMSVDEARDFFSSGPAREIVDRLADLGLGYLRLGQPLNTLSGGERQRLKLAVHMAGKATTYVLDEPTSGLHLADVDQLLALLDRLVDDGNTVIVIEHHRAVMAHADWLVDLGPGAGHDGGKVVFTGTPADMIANCDSLTAQHLRAYVNGSKTARPTRRKKRASE